MARFVWRHSSDSTIPPLYVQVKMYEKYAEMQGWRTTVVSLSEVRHPGQGSGVSRLSSRVCKRDCAHRLVAAVARCNRDITPRTGPLWSCTCDLVTVWVSSNQSGQR
jgi:hypothetical protein